MLLSARIAYEALQFAGWQKEAVIASNCWENGKQYQLKGGIERYTASLIVAANWDIEHANEKADTMRKS